MRVFLLLFLLAGFAASAVAQTSSSRDRAENPATASTSAAPIGILKGDLLEWDGTETGGHLSLRSSDNRVFRCSFDTKTYFERDRQRVAVGQMTVGDWIELVSDSAGAGTNNCYARTVHVLPPARPAVPAYMRKRIQARRSAFLDSIAPRGNLTFAGVLLRRTPDAIWIRTRSDGEKTILLRQDTRFLSAGAPVEVGALTVNTRVFIRAGRNLDNDLEAFQVVWGEILNVR